MYKAKFTKAGAKKMGDPHLAGKEFEYDRIVGKCVGNIFVNGKRLGVNLSFAGRTPGCVLIRPIPGRG
jgi:hypothetical protein